MNNEWWMPLLNIMRASLQDALDSESELKFICIAYLQRLLSCVSCQFVRLSVCLFFICPQDWISSMLAWLVNVRLEFDRLKCLSFFCSAFSSSAFSAPFYFDWKKDVLVSTCFCLSFYLHFVTNEWMNSVSWSLCSVMLRYLTAGLVFDFRFPCCNRDQ